MFRLVNCIPLVVICQWFFITDTIYDEDEVLLALAEQVGILSCIWSQLVETVTLIKEFKFLSETVYIRFLKF